MRIGRQFARNVAAMGLALVIGAQAHAADAPEAPPERIPTATFAVRPLVSQPVLSPDGLHIAARLSISGKEELAVADLTGKEKTRAFTLPPKSDLVRYFWAGTHILVTSFGQTMEWYDHDDAYVTRMMAFDTSTGKVHVVGKAIAGQTGDDVLWTDPEGHYLLVAYQSSIYEYPGVSKIDLATDRATSVVSPIDDIWDWYADAGGVVRYGFGYTSPHNWQMVYRSNEHERFKVALRGNTDKDDDAMIDHVVQLSQGSDSGYVIDSTDDNPWRAIYAYDFAQHKRGALVYAAPDADVEEGRTDSAGQHLIAAWYTDNHARTHWFDETLAKVQADLDHAVGAGRQAYIAAHSRDYGILIVAVTADNDPGSYYTFRVSDGVMQRFAAVNEGLKPAQLVHSRYVEYKARDGTTIKAYLTLPKGRNPAHLPLIIHPHGGPFGIRDDGGYDEEVQFFANRGYAVLQPEFRGSGGYGRRFEKVADGQWGRAMQDDLDDGMDWLAHEGTIDPARVCVVGSSYGGYAALWAATRNPERYRCAASFAGISDVPKWLKYSGRGEGSRGRETWRATLQGEKAFDLKTVSPLYTVERLKVPVLVAHGDADTQVPFKQSKLYADALKAAGKTHEFVVIPDEGHGFVKAIHEQLWLDRLDAFLAKYNPAG